MALQPAVAWRSAGGSHRSRSQRRSGYAAGPPWVFTGRWAARVLVNSLEARNHGKMEVGLPSHLAKFLPTTHAPAKQKQPWWNPFFTNSIQTGVKHGFDIMEINGSSCKPLCHLTLPSSWTKYECQSQWVGPSLKISLPSFSGRTEEQPRLLKYSCELCCSIKPIKPATITDTSVLSNDIDGKIEIHDMDFNAVVSLLTAKPLLALSFEGMSMHVQAPSVVVSRSERFKEYGKSFISLWRTFVPVNRPQ